MQFWESYEKCEKTLRYWTCRNRRKKKLFSVRTKLSYWKVFHRISVSNRNEKTQILMNKPVYLGLSILQLRKILIYKLWYDYVKPKYGGKAKLCYMDRDSFVILVKTDIYKEIAEDVELRFDASNYELNRPLPIGKIRKVIGLMKEELGGKIMKNLLD